MLKKLFVHYEGAVPHAIDYIHPKTGRSMFNNEDLAAIQKRYPGAVIMSYDEYETKRENALITSTHEISEERFRYMLEVLPPVSWVSGGGSESFKLSERTSGNITAICCRIKDKFFEFQNVITMQHDAIVETCTPLYKHYKQLEGLV